MNKCSYKISIIILSIIFIVSCKSIDSDLDIIKGNFVNEKDYPTVIKIFDDNNEVICSGIIVSENVVLTAAHCVMDTVEDEKTGEAREVHGGDRWVKVNHIFIKGYTVELPVEYIQEFFKYELIAKKLGEIENNYRDRVLSRSQYESSVKGLLNILPKFHTDLGAIIFKNNWFGLGNPPFKSIIEKAKQDGKFFSLSRNSFEKGTVLTEDKRSLFFLGYGSNNSNSYNTVGKLNKNDEDIKGLQIGYNSVKYSKKENSWETPGPEEGSSISQDLLTSTNAYFGDSGGPLIYKNQIIGLITSGLYFDCEGNSQGQGPMSDRFLGIDPSTRRKMTREEIDKDPCAQKYRYANSIFTSITLGSDSKFAESFIEEVNKKLSACDLLKNGSNSIFSELLKK